MMRPPRAPARPLSERRANETDNADNDDSSSSSEDESESECGGRYQPPRPSMVPVRHRRRSSVGHHRLSVASVASTANVTELYQKAIRLNAENKINVTNSWNLKLIDHMDQILEEDDTNFTKASCTLDASVKIYGYRVDDVFLTSYKVLANLNRSDNNKKNRRDGPDNDETAAAELEGDEAVPGDGDDARNGGRTQRNPAQRKQQRGNTLEEKLSNINLSNLDSVYDIDPLFHKMSAAFDEGGAKGLLLVNLGIGDSCNIVFESMEDDDVDETLVVGVSGDNIDIHSLRQKLEAQLEDEELFELPLVPQLSSLRAEHDSLVEAGFCEAAVMNTVGPKTPGRRRYKASSDDEAMADRSIHEQVRGRLGFSMADDEEGETQIGTPPQGDVSIGRHSTSVVNFATDNEYGGDYDDHDDDVVFDNFMANPRFSEEPEQRNDATHLLDAIASGRAQLSTDAFTYFPDKNQWAGSDHWKKKNTTIKKKSTKTKLTKPKKAKSALVDLDTAPDVSKYLKSSKASTTWTKTTVKKNTDEDHVLPIDSNINVEHLTKLFLRPDYTPTDQNKESTDEGDKRVSFGLPMVYDDGSFGGGDGDGPGFDFAEPDCSTGDDDFFIDDLEGIRKVQRIKVGYASVAKKVDVKKLKHELWSELETRIGYGKGTGADEDMVEELGKAATELDDATPFSFQEVLKQLESQQSQPDVTFSFYFICALHLANEKGLIFESQGLDDFTIAVDHDVIAE